ncbi:MAG: UbiH/UbiF/VisC/COQ6 family ubiquinone biosynthesis hydroxylase [Paracoccaceae bacterium]
MPKPAPISKVMTRDADVIIVGGGLNGATLALALAQNGLRVTLIDAHPNTTQKTPTFDGRSYALALTSCRMFQALGLWDDLASNAQPILDIKVSDGRVGEGPSPFFMHFSHTEIEEGPMGHMIEDRHLRPVLIKAIANAPLITHLAPKTVISQDSQPGGVSVVLDDGTTLGALLIIGADGRGSGVAQRSAIKRIGWRYGQTALVAAIEHELPHDGIAHQFFMPAGPLAILPLPGNKSSIVWSETDANAGLFNALPEDEYLTMLRPRFGDFLGQIKLAGDRFTYPLSLSLAQNMIAPRVALVGDAAHGVHPISGQGLNAGLRDIAAFVQVLGEARHRGEDLGAVPVLRRYEEWRRFDNTTLAIATDGFNRLFSNDNPLLRIGRDLGMGMINGLPGLRRNFIREAAGLTGELPQLMQ